MADPAGPGTAVLVIGHGRLGEALVETAGMIIGPVPKTYAIGFLPSEGVEDLDAAVRRIIDGLAPDDGILCLVDLPGGSPARVLGGLVLGSSLRVEAVTGVNVPMLLEVLLRRDDMDLPDLAAYAARVAADGIVNLRPALAAADTRSGDHLHAP